MYCSLTGMKLINPGELEKQCIDRRATKWNRKTASSSTWTSSVREILRSSTAEDSLS